MKNLQKIIKLSRFGPDLFTSAIWIQELHNKQGR